MTWNKEKYIEEVFNTLNKERDVEEVINSFKNASKKTVILNKEDFSLPYDPTEEQKEKVVENGTIIIERPNVNNNSNGRLRKKII